MPMSAIAMKSAPSPALRAAVRRKFASESPTGRAMPSLRPDPDGSGVVTTIQSASRAVAGPSTLATLPSDSTRARSASLRV